MNEEEQERMKQLLRQALPPVQADVEPARDLWPAVLRRLDEKQALPWFDWALGAGLAAFVVFFPASIPVFLYYL